LGDPADAPQIGVPYIRAKAQDYFEQLGGGVDADLLEGNGAPTQSSNVQSEVTIVGLSVLAVLLTDFRLVLRSSLASHIQKTVSVGKHSL
jgi:hypothetical protein